MCRTGQASIVLRSLIALLVLRQLIISYSSNIYIYGSIGTTNPYKKFSAYVISNLTHHFYQTTSRTCKQPKNSRKEGQRLGTAPWLAFRWLHRYSVEIETRTNVRQNLMLLILYPVPLFRWGAPLFTEPAHVFIRRRTSGCMRPANGIRATWSGIALCTNLFAMLACSSPRLVCISCI